MSRPAERSGFDQVQASFDPIDAGVELPELPLHASHGREQAAQMVVVRRQANLDIVEAPPNLGIVRLEALQNLKDEILV